MARKPGKGIRRIKWAQLKLPLRDKPQEPKDTDTMNNFLTDIRDYLHDRFGNPFWLSAIFAWLIINWPITVTAIFQTDLLTVDYIYEYINEKSSFRHLWLPLIFGFIYSIFCGVLKETIEGVAKSCRSFVAEKFNSLGFYRSISIEEHNKKITTLERRIIRNEFKQSEIDELKSDFEKATSDLNSYREERIQLESIIIEALTTSSPIDNQEKIEVLEKLHGISICEEIDKSDIENTSKTIAEDDEYAPLIKQHKRKGLISSAMDAHASIPKGLSFPEAIKKHEEDEIQDPNSIKPLLLTLLFHLSPHAQMKPVNPELIGLKNNVYKKCLQRSMNTGFIKRDGKTGNYVTSSEGSQYLLKELANKSNSRIKTILNESEKTTKNTILAKLKNNHFSVQELINSSPFHPYIRKIIDDLERNGEVINRSGILFPARNS